MRWFVILALVISSVVAQPVLAQERGKTAKDYTYAPDSPVYWRNMHGASSNTFVFRRDPNIWVYTKEVAQRAGMPLEWVSDELKGVAAAAFRMERHGAEEDCGWGKNPAACKPVVRCVLELYFDRQTQQLPWAPRRMVADFNWQNESTPYHLLPALGWAVEANGDVSRGSKRSPNFPDLGTQPFSDPQTGEELIWANAGVNAGWGVLAYDREMHGRYAFVRLDDGCGRSEFDFKNEQVLQLRPGRRFAPVGHKVFYEVSLPTSWVRRVRELTQQNQKADNDFYKNTWENMNRGDKR